MMNRKDKRAEGSGHGLFKVIFQHMLEGIGGNPRIISVRIKSQPRFEVGTFEYEAAVLTTRSGLYFKQKITSW
jgi:hypothetical protein